MTSTITTAQSTPIPVPPVASLSTLDILDAIDGLAERYDVPWELRTAFKGGVLEVVAKVEGR
jgi:hypothetical protein